MCHTTSKPLILLSFELLSVGLNFYSYFGLAQLVTGKIYNKNSLFFVERFACQSMKLNFDNRAYPNQASHNTRITYNNINLFCFVFRKLLEFVTLSSIC